MSGENENGVSEEAEFPPGGGADDIEALKAEIEALKDRSLRALAEAENVRKRAERERDELRQYGIAKFARDVLSIADNLARALAAYPPEARENAGDAMKAVIDGVEATSRELQAVLARHGVKLIEAEGARFDPHLHQAIAEVPAAGKAPGTVVHVVQSGYTINDRLLRPAMVTVARAEGAPKPGGNGAGGNLDTSA